MKKTEEAAADGMRSFLHTSRQSGHLVEELEGSTANLNLIAVLRASCFVLRLKNNLVCSRPTRVCFPQLPTFDRVSGKEKEKHQKFDILKVKYYKVGLICWT